MTSDRPLTYRDAGVDIEAGDALVERIKPAVARTRREGVMGSLGGFGGLFALPVDKYRAPVLVSGTDGVGTKLRLAIDCARHDGVGVDLVGMCANDVVVQGAEPLFFLDYYATGRLDVDVAQSVIEGIARGCELAGAALIGGETAEMPGMYEGADYDLAGFCVGIAERERLIDPQAVSAGDVMIALGSSGPHSNGYSLIRRVLDTAGGIDAAPDGALQGADLIEVLLSPTRIYVRAVLATHEAVGLHAAAHITGGGLPGNLVRVLPAHLDAVVEQASWEIPAVFQWLQAHGQIEQNEMYRTFNCGVGMVLVVAPEQAEQALSTARQHGEQAWVLGHIAPGQQQVVFAP